MANGADRNFIRLCATIDGFRIRYKAWPTAVRLRAGVLADLRDHVLGPVAFAKVEAKLRLIPDDADMVAEDGTGCTYKYEGNCFPDQVLDIPARDWLGVEALEEVRYDRAMEAAILRAAQPNYLGDLTVINKLLRTYAYTCLKRRATETPVHESSKMDVSEAHDLADIFLGKNKEYQPMLPWNSAGHIDRWLNDSLEVEGDTPQEVVARAIVTFLLEIYRITKESDENPLPGRWEKEVDAASSNFTKLFIGIWPFARAEKKSQTDDPSVTASPEAE